MSDANTPKKAESVSKVKETAKTEVAKTTADKTETSKAETKSADSSTPQADSSPKSAAQSSISHFSSVSTPQYRSGWDKIFGKHSDAKEPVPENVSESAFPVNLEISDGEVDAVLREVLNETFIEVAKKHGVTVSGSSRCEYNITCQIKQA